MSINITPTFQSEVLTFHNGTTTTSNGASINVDGYSTLLLKVQISSSASVFFEGSLDNSTFDPITVISSQANSSNPFPLNGVSSSGTFQVPILGFKFFRARAIITSGAVTVTGSLSIGALRSPMGSILGTQTDGLSSSSFPSVLTSSLGYVFNETANSWSRQKGPSADAMSVTGLAAAGSMVFNGSTWDRLRTVSIGDAVATGVLANGNYLYDSSGAVWNRLRGANGNLDTSDGTRFPGSGLMAYNGSTWERIRTVAGVADGATTGLAAEGGYGWNGTGWDRVRANNVHKYQEYLSLTNGQHLEIWTPAAGKKFRLMNVLFSSNYATGAKVTLRDAVGGTTVGASNLATFNFNAKDTNSFQFGPNGYLSFQANNRLAVFNDSGATVSVWLTFIGTEE